MNEEEVRFTIWMFSDMFPRHSRPVVVLSKESAQEMLDRVDQFAIGLKTLIEQTTQVEVIPND
ncbi:MAG TPA: hypothetical protein VGN34_26010 [Ktedonobacteraceae bacterium]|jgi:hypothetical protein